MIHRLRTQAICCLLAVAATTGCSMGKSGSWNFAKSVDPRQAFNKQEDEEVAEPQIPTRLVSTWTDTTLHRTGELGKRGFGGRLLFFNNEGEDSIRVDGRLVVYAYDENGRAAHETHPTRRYVFPADQFVRHESSTSLGASYSVWIPWDAIGGEQKNISLIARFEPKGGALIVGDQTRHLLPGTRTLAKNKKTQTPDPVSKIQLTEYTQESKLKAPKTAPQAGVTSISLPTKSWTKRLGK